MTTTAQPALFDDTPTEGGDDMLRTADLSPDGVYRYALHRRWGPGGIGVFVMLNPSTADALKDDPTIRRCIGFCRSWGLGALTVVNLYAYRSTDPKGLWTAPDPVGPRNDSTLRFWLNGATQGFLPVVCAWGANARPDRVKRLIALADCAPLQCLGTTKAGAPKHPLYLAATTERRPYLPTTPEQGA